MATNGIVSIVKNGTLIMRLTAGFNGYEAPVLREKIESNLELATNPQAVFDMAKSVRFGCQECLVLAYDAGNKYIYEDGELTAKEAAELKVKLDDPEWNTRCPNGYSDYVEVIHI